MLWADRSRGSYENEASAGGDFLAPRTADGRWQLRLLASGRRFVDLLQVSEHVGSEQASRSTVTISEQIHQLYCTLSALPAMDA